MFIKSLESLVGTENTAKGFLTSLCWKNYRRFCTKCNSYRICRIIGIRFRCKRRKYTFHDFTGRGVHTLKISCQDRLWIIEFFEVELSARKITRQTDLRCPTALKAVTSIREAIAANSSDAGDLLSGEVELDEILRGRDRRLLALRRFETGEKIAMKESS